MYNVLESKFFLCPKKLLSLTLMLESYLLDIILMIILLVCKYYLKMIISTTTKLGFSLHRQVKKIPCLIVLVGILSV